MGNPLFIKDAFQLKNLFIFFQGVIEEFGIKFTLLCVSVNLGIKGTIRQFVRSVELPFYMDGKWNASQYQTNLAISSAPMALKGICGVLSDILPIFGFEKTIYFCIYTIIGFLACLCFIIMPMNEDNTFLGIPGLLFFCMQMEVAFLDLLAEGKYVEIMNSQHENRGNIITFSYLCVTLGEIIPHFFVGSLHNILHIRIMFSIFLPFTIQPLFFIFCGCMINDRVTPQRNNKIDFIKIKQQRYIFSLSFIMFITSSGSIIMALFTSPTIQFYYAIVAGIICTVFGYNTLPKVVANVNFYIFISSCLFVNMTAALEYYYTSGPECVPNGPFFDILFMRTYAGIGTVFAKFIGLWIFQAFLTHLKIRISYWSTTLLRVLASIVDIIIIKRWNLDIGIPDRVIYFFGNAVALEICTMMDHMPSAIIMAKFSPKYVEGTVFAILASFGNFGQNVARFVGGFLIEFFGVQLDNNGDCNIDHLLTIIIIGHLILPLLGIPLTFLLVPNAYVKDNFTHLVYSNSKFYYNTDHYSKHIST